MSRPCARRASSRLPQSSAMGVERQDDDASNARRRIGHAVREGVWALTSLEVVRWTQRRHRLEEDVRDLELRAPREEARARTDDGLGQARTLCVGVGLARTQRKAAKPGRRIPKRGASEASKDGEKGTSHGQNSVAESGRGRKRYEAAARLERARASGPRAVRRARRDRVTVDGRVAPLKGDDREDLC